MFYFGWCNKIASCLLNDDRNCETAKNTNDELRDGKYARSQFPCERRDGVNDGWCQARTCCKKKSAMRDDRPGDFVEHYMPFLWLHLINNKSF